MHFDSYRWRIGPTVASLTVALGLLALAGCQSVAPSSGSGTSGAAVTTAQATASTEMATTMPEATSATGGAGTEMATTTPEATSATGGAGTEMATATSEATSAAGAGTEMATTMPEATSATGGAGTEAATPAAGATDTTGTSGAAGVAMGDDGIPVVTLTVNADGMSMPATVPAGIVAFQVNNDGGPEGVAPEFARLNAGVTLEQLNAAMAGPDEMAALALVTLLGTPSTSADGRVIHDLTEGDYVAVLFGPDGPPLMTSFTVGGASSDATAPAADVTAQLVDFNFVLPDTIAAGPHVWQIENTGEQWHEMSIVKLNEGTTIEDVMKMMAEAGPQGPSGKPPFQDVAYFSPMGAGERAWVKWDLPAGEYTVLCFLPDMKGDMSPHATHGMVRTLVVK